MPRTRPTHYVGATGGIPIGEVAALGARHVIQKKHDGIYVRVYLDGRGRVAKVFMRNGAEVPAHLTTHLRGALVGTPHAELVGEFDAMTEAAEVAAKRGPRKVHLFDCLFDGKRSLVAEPYRVRRDALYRMLARTEVHAPNDDHRPAPYRRYRDPVPPGWRLFPIIEQVPTARAAWAWEAWVKEPDGEGLVVVALDAKVGGRQAKRKCKPWETLDCEAVAVARTIVTCSWNGHLFNVGRGKHHVELGEVVEIKHAGWSSVGVLPRFPAIVRVRRDKILQ